MDAADRRILRGDAIIGFAKAEFTWPAKTHAQLSLVRGAHGKLSSVPIAGSTPKRRGGSPFSTQRQNFIFERHRPLSR